MHSICSGPFYVNVLIGMAKHTNKRFIFSKLIRMVSICILTKLVHTLGASGLREPRSLFRSNEDSFSDLFFRSSLKVMSTNNPCIFNNSLVGKTGGEGVEEPILKN